MRHEWPIVENEAATMLRKTIELIERRGWRQSAACHPTPDGSLCPLDALWTACDEARVSPSVRTAAGWALQAAVGARSFVVWQAKNGRTWSEVRGAIINAIEIAAKMPVRAA